MIVAIDRDHYIVDPYAYERLVKRNTNVADNSTDWDKVISWIEQSSEPATKKHIQSAGVRVRFRRGKGKVNVKKPNDLPPVPAAPPRDLAVSIRARIRWGRWEVVGDQHSITGVYLDDESGNDYQINVTVPSDIYRRTTAPEFDGAASRLVNEYFEEALTRLVEQVRADRDAV